MLGDDALAPQVAGYAREVEVDGEKLVQVLVRGAGHIVPYDQPRAALDMVRPDTVAMRDSPTHDSSVLSPETRSLKGMVRPERLP